MEVDHLHEVERELDVAESDESSRVGTPVLADDALEGAWIVTLV